MREKPVPTDRLLASIAARQHVVVTLAQLTDAGVGRAGITRRVQAGRLHRVHRGVYAVGNPRLTYEGRCLAAVLACGPLAAASHGSAAAVWGMLAPLDGPIHIAIR